MIRFFREHVFHNVGLKLMALAIALLLWMAVARDPVAEMAVTVPLEFHHVPDYLEISSDSLPQVQIRVRGPAHALREAAPADVHALLDLSNAKPGEITYELTARQIHLPAGVNVVQVIPSLVRINFDTRAMRMIPVRPRVVGTFASGYRISHIVCDPSSIAIVGPKKRVEAIEDAITDPVDATGVVDQATFTTHLFVPDPLVRIVHSEPVHVTVSVTRPERPGRD